MWCLLKIYSKNKEFYRKQTKRSCGEVQTRFSTKRTACVEKEIALPENTAVILEKSSFLPAGNGL